MRYYRPFQVLFPWSRFQRGRAPPLRHPPSGPALASVPRSAESRRQLGRQAALFRSRLAWTLFFAGCAGAAVGLFTPMGLMALSPLAGLLALAAPIAAFKGAFGFRRETRFFWSLVLLAGGAGMRYWSALGWPGTAMLAAAFGLLGRAFTGPDARWIRKRNILWIRAHARPPSPTAVPPPLAGRPRTRLLRADLRESAARFRSPARWWLLGLLAMFAGLEMAVTEFRRESDLHFAAVLAVVAGGVAAFGVNRWIRLLAGVAAAGLGAWCFAAGAFPPLALPVIPLALALGALPDAPEAEGHPSPGGDPRVDAEGPCGRRAPR